MLNPQKTKERKTETKRVINKTMGIPKHINHQVKYKRSKLTTKKTISHIDSQVRRTQLHAVCKKLISLYNATGRLNGHQKQTEDNTNQKKMQHTGIRKSRQHKKVNYKRRDTA